MPTQLPNGPLVFNATPHDIFFQSEEGVTVSHSDSVINALPRHTEVNSDSSRYELVLLEWVPSASGNKVIRMARQLYQDVLIVGSVIAAQAFPGKVVALVPIKSADRVRTYRSDRFVTYKKEQKRG